MGVPVDEARLLFKTIKGCYRELYHTHTYAFVEPVLSSSWKCSAGPGKSGDEHMATVLTSIGQFVHSHHAEAVSASRAEPILRHLRRVLQQAECACSSDGGAACSAVLDGKALMHIQSTATWLHIFCALLCTSILNQTSQLSEAVERSFYNDLDTVGQPQYVQQARHHLQRSAVAAVRASPNTSDFQAALAKAVPLLMPLITSCKERDWLLVLIGRLVSNISDVAEGELRSTLTWLATNSQELHREIRQKILPLQGGLDAIKTAIASMHSISAAETSHWDKLLHEALHGLRTSGAVGELSEQSTADVRRTAEQVLSHLRDSDDVPACPVVGLPYTVLPPTSPTDSTNELKNNCRAVTLTCCGCCMSVHAARRAISSRVCPLCSEAVEAGSGYKDNACISRAAQLWAAGVTPRKLTENDLDVDLDVRLRLPPRAVADGILCRGKMRATGEPLAVLVVPLGKTAHWERSAVNHALVVSAAAAALTPLMCTVVGVCWRASDVLIAFPAEYLLDGPAAESEDSEGAEARSGTLTSATQLVARMNMEAGSSSPGLSTTDALEVGLSLAEVQRVACDNMLAAPHPSLQTLTPDNVFFTADGCSVRVPFWTPLSLPCVPPKAALRLREAAAQAHPMAHSATRSPSTRYTAPEVVNSTSLDHTAAFGDTVAFAAPAAAGMQTVNVDKAAVYTVGAVLQFCTSGQAPPSAEELLGNFTVTLPLGSSSRFHEAASRYLHASSDMTLRMATRVASAMDPDISVRPSLDALQGMLLQELAALEHPLTTIAEGDSEETSSSVGQSGKQSTQQCASGHQASHQAGAAVMQQSADMRAGDSESSLHRSGSRLRPAWDRSDSAQHTLPLAQSQHVHPLVFVPPQVPSDCPTTSLQSTTPPQFVDAAADVHSEGDDTAPSQVSTGPDTTEHSITGGAGHTGAGATTGASRRSSYSTRDFPPAEFKPVEVKPWEARLAMQAGQAMAADPAAAMPPPTYSGQHSKEMAAGSLALSVMSSRPTAFDSQGLCSAQGQAAARPSHTTPPAVSPRVSYGASDSPRPAVDSPHKSGLESRNSSYGALASPQASLDMRGHRIESHGSGEAARGASSPRHLSMRSMSGSKKGPRTLQQLIQSMNSGTKGAVVDLAGCSYKSSKGWFTSLSNLSRLSSTSSFGSRSSTPAPLPDQDQTGSALCPDNLQLVQTPINLSDSTFNARSIFELHKAPPATRGSLGAAKMHVTSGHVTVANGKLLLPSGGQMVLGPTCQDLEFKDITFQDGTILCHGAGCSTKFTNCIFKATQVLVVEGAHTTISSDKPQPAKRSLASAAACMQNSAIAVFASGAGTTVVLQDLVVEHCQQAICVDGGARVDMQRVDLYGMNVTGCEARGQGSVMSLQACRVFAATAPAQPNWRIQGVWVHSGAQCTIERCSIERVPSGVAADGQGTHLSVSESWIRGNAACGVFVGYGARAEISMSSLDVHEEAGQFVGLHVMGHRSHATFKGCTARGNSGYGVHVSDHACVVAERVTTQGNGYGAWLVEGPGAQASLESCESRNETSYCSKQGGNIRKLLCRP